MACSYHPSVAWGGMHWDSATDWRARLLQFPQSISLLSINRDRDSTGKVTWDPVGRVPNVAYNLAAFDRNSMLQALIGCAEILVSAGADEMASAANLWPVYKVDKKVP